MSGEDLHTSSQSVNPQQQEGETPSESETPSLADLYEKITPKYAADWKVIGTLLGLPIGELTAIEAGWPTNVKWCCNQMLEKWLEVDPTASWGKLFTVIESPAVSSGQAVDKVNTTPLLKDLYQHITPQYAADWKVIGTLLGLPSRELKAIEAGYPTDVKWRCCNQMLEKWLEIDPTASWGKLLTVIELPAISGPCSGPCSGSTVKSGNAMDQLSDHLKMYYRHLGYRDKDHFTLKSYIPLALVNQKELQTEQDTTNAAYLRMKGNIDKIPQTIDAKKLIGISEIFDPVSGTIPNVILIEGHSGIGKTTFVKEICINWAKGKILKCNKLVLLLLLRDPNVQKISDELALIQHFTKSFTKHSTTELYNDLIINKGAKVTLIIDGFNELGTGLRKDSFFRKVIEKEVLLCATVLVTSRPSASVCLHNSVHKRIEILGFEKSSRKEYVAKALQGSPSKLEKLKNHFKQYPSIDAMCYIPLIMSIVVFLCMCQPDDHGLPQTATKMYRSFILHTIKRYLKNTDDESINKLEELPEVVRTTLQKLKKVAFEGLIKDKIKTHGSESRGQEEAGLRDEPNTKFYSTEGTLIQSFNFLHLGIQEYFAAEYITTLPEDEVYTHLKKSFIVTESSNNNESVRLSKMWILYCGITSGQSKTLRHYLTTYGKSNHTLPVKATNNDANSHVTSVTVNGRSQQGSSSDHRISNTINISPHILNDPVKILYLFQCFQEAQDNVLCKVLSKSFDSGIIDISDHTLLPFQVTSLGFFLSKSCRKWKELNLSNCHINDHGLQQFLSGDNLNRQEIKEIVFRNNSLTEASSRYIARIMIYLVKLYINNNKLGDHGARVISEGIANTKTLQLLNISNNNIGSSGTISIANALASNTSLMELFMEDNEVGQFGAVAIADAITNNRTLKTLSLDNNTIDKESLMIIIERINKNDIIAKISLPYTPEFHDDIIKEEIMKINMDRKERCKEPFELKR